MDTNTGSGMDAGSTDTGSSEGADSSSEMDSNQVAEGEGQVTKAEIKAMKERFKFTVDGEDFEEEIDLSDKETLRKKLQMSHAAQKRMAEAKVAKQKAAEIVKAFESDPSNILRRLGPKGREAAEKFLLEQIQDEMLSPEEKEYRELKKYKEMSESEKAKAKEEAEQKASAAKEAKYADDYQKTIIGALEKTGLPKTPALVKQMAKLMKDNLEQGLELTAEELAAEARNDTTALLKSIIKDADGDQLVAMFGEEIANKIRKSDLKKLRERQGQLFESRDSKVPEQRSEPNQSRPMTMEEWKESIAARIK